LSGKTITEATAEQAGSLAVSGAKALSRNGYKIQLARVAVKRALLRAAEGGR
jgi:xanthine dehydrogenase YagS FAD-binding subunit